MKILLVPILVLFCFIQVVHASPSALTYFNDIIITDDDDSVLTTTGISFGWSDVTMGDTNVDGVTIGTYATEDSLLSNADDATGTTLHLSESIDLSRVDEIVLSDEILEQLSNYIKQKTRKEFRKMELNVSLSWGTWFMIFVVGVIAAKIAHRITLKTIFKPTKKAAAAAEKISKETAQHIKREWEDS